MTAIRYSGLFFPSDGSGPVHHFKVTAENGDTVATLQIAVSDSGLVEDQIKDAHRVMADELERWVGELRRHTGTEG